MIQVIPKQQAIIIKNKISGYALMSSFCFRPFTLYRERLGGTF